MKKFSLAVSLFFSISGFVYAEEAPPDSSDWENAFQVVLLPVWVGADFCQDEVSWEIWSRAPEAKTRLRKAVYDRSVSEDAAGEILDRLASTREMAMEIGFSLKEKETLCRNFEEAMRIALPDLP